MTEHRDKTRTTFTCRIKIWQEGGESALVKTRDISDSGVYIVAPEEFIPPLGSKVKGQVQGMMAEAPVLEMEVVRVEKDGMGLKFV